MDAMGQQAGASHGVVRTRSSPISSCALSRPLAVELCPAHDRGRHLPPCQTIAATVAAGPPRQCHNLKCRTRDTLLSITSCCRSSRAFDFPTPSANSSNGLSNLSIPESIHVPFRPKRKMSQDRLHFRKAGADDDIYDNENPIGTRKVVEHIVLLKMKDTLTEEQEKEMLDNLWSVQYQIKNVLCITVGRLVQRTPEGFTHALLSRFENKQALDEYMDSPTRWRVVQDLVIPFYQGKLIVDFEGEVEDDIETIFRRGDDFQEGVEHLLLFRFKGDISSDVVDKFLMTASSLPAKFGALVQLTVGANFESESKGMYTHGLVARLPSEDAHREFEEFLQADSSWIEATELFETSQTLTANFVVSPIGKTVM